LDGNSSARIQRQGDASGSLTRGVTIPTSDLVTSVTYYATDIGTCFNDYVLGLSFSDNSYLFFTFNQGSNSSSVRYIQVPRVENRWTQYSQNITQDLLQSYGTANKTVTTVYVSVCDIGETLYLDQIHFLSGAGTQYMEGVCGALKLLSIRYLLFDESTIGANIEGFSTAASKLNLSLARTMGYVSIYSNPNYNPHLYATTHITIANNTEDLLRSACNSTSNYLGVLSSDAPNSVDTGSSDATTPLTSIVSDNLGYRVQVTDAHSSFYLVLSEDYSSDWVATVNGTPLNHFVANGYANGWLVNRAGSFVIEIGNALRFFTYVGLGIGGAFIMLLLAVYVLRRMGFHFRAMRLFKRGISRKVSVAWKGGLLSRCSDNISALHFCLETAV
jgi:hypothetical protein